MQELSKAIYTIITVILFYLTSLLPQLRFFTKNRLVWAFNPYKPDSFN